MHRLQDEERREVTALRILYVTGCIVVLDQITKLLVKGFTLPVFDYSHAGMQIGQSIPVIGNFFRLTFVENPGMAFGIEFGSKPVITLFILAASIAIFVYLYRRRNRSFAERLTLAMILGGAIGNLIDRMFYGVIFGEAPLLYGKVVDFLDFDFFTVNIFSFHMHRFAVFNIADASVSIGIVLMLLLHKKFTEMDAPPAAADSPASVLPQPPDEMPESKHDAPDSTMNPV